VTQDLGAHLAKEFSALNFGCNTHGNTRQHTATQCTTTQELGAQLAKEFPALNLGRAFVRSLVGRAVADFQVLYFQYIYIYICIYIYLCIY